MKGHLAIAPADAIAELVFHLVAAGGDLPLYIDRLPNPLAELRGPHDRLGARVARIAARLDMEESREVALALPTTGGYVYRSMVLWTWAKTTEQGLEAAKFSPEPSIVLRMGRSAVRLLVWALRNPVNEADCTTFNERLAWRIGAPRTATAAAQLRLPLPGTFRRVGRRVPAPVLLTKFDLSRAYEAQEIAGKLREPPPKDAWKERKERERERA